MALSQRIAGQLRQPSWLAGRVIGHVSRSVIQLATPSAKVMLARADEVRGRDTDAPGPGPTPHRELCVRDPDGLGHTTGRDPRA